MRRQKKVWNKKFTLHLYKGPAWALLSLPKLSGERLRELRYYSQAWVEHIALKKACLYSNRLHWMKVLEKHT